MNKIYIVFVIFAFCQKLIATEVIPMVESVWFKQAPESYEEAWKDAVKISGKPISSIQDLSVNNILVAAVHNKVSQRRFLIYRFSDFMFLIIQTFDVDRVIVSVVNYPPDCIPASLMERITSFVLVAPDLKLPKKGGIGSPIRSRGILDMKTIKLALPSLN